MEIIYDKPANGIVIRRRCCRGSSTQGQLIISVIILNMMIVLTSSTTLRGGHHRQLKDEGGTAYDEFSPKLGPPSCETYDPDAAQPDVRLAFFGNSILYFNDCQRLIQQMMMESGLQTAQESCVRGGATFMTLFDGSCKMPQFRADPVITINGDQCNQVDGYKKVEKILKRYDDTDQHAYDYIIMNDQSQFPARQDTRTESVWSIENQYYKSWPTRSDGTPSIPILVQTPAYKYPMMLYTDDLGDFHDFSDAIKEGMEQYKDAFDGALPTTTKARIAPVGEGFRYLYDNDQALFDKLYVADNYHPNPYGTYLQACIIYMTILQDSKKPPPPYNPDWWLASRMLVDEHGLPTDDEAKELHNVACKVMGVDPSDDYIQGKTDTDDSVGDDVATPALSEADSYVATDAPSDFDTDETVDADVETDATKKIDVVEAKAGKKVKPTGRSEKEIKPEETNILAGLPSVTDYAKMAKQGKGQKDEGSSDDAPDSKKEGKDDKSTDNKGGKIEDDNSGKTEKGKEETDALPSDSPSDESSDAPSDVGTDPPSDLDVDDSRKGDDVQADADGKEDDIKEHGKGKADDGKMDKGDKDAPSKDKKGKKKSPK